MGAERLAERIRQEARAKEQRIETALAAIDALTPDEAEFVYVKLEKKILGSSERSASPSRAPTVPEKKSKPTKTKAKKKINKATVQPSKYATKSPSYAERAEKFVLANPHGVRTYEVGKAIGQSVPNVFGTLKLLEGQKRVERHGTRYKTLWTPPGVKPVARIETGDAAIVHVLANGPMNGRDVRSAAAKLFTRETGKKLSPVSFKTLLSKLVAKGTIVHRGANEHGVLYALPGEKGAPDRATLN